MAEKYSADELNTFSKEMLVNLILGMQGQIDTLNESIGKLTGLVRVASQHRFGRRTERIDEIAGQMSLFNEAEAYSEEAAAEPDGDEVIITVKRKKKAKGNNYNSGYRGILVTDGLQQYHMLEGLIDGFTNENCWAHARRDFADAVKAIGKSDQEAIRRSVAYQALARIRTIFKLEMPLKAMSAEERLKERRKSIAPLVEEYSKANNLNPYYYLDHILTELPKLVDTEGKIATKKLVERKLISYTNE